MNDSDTAEVAKALSHPLRIEVIRALRDRRDLSPVEFARDFEVPLGNASYHIKALLASEVIAVCGEIPRRGAMEHRYCLTGRRAGITLSVLELLSTA